jgi:hypothetical protein
MRDGEKEGYNLYRKIRWARGRPITKEKVQCCDSESHFDKNQEAKNGWSGPWTKEPERHQTLNIVFTGV